LQKSEKYDSIIISSAVKIWVDCIENKLLVCPTVHLICFAYLSAVSLL